MVEQIPIPPELHAQAALARIDYSDAFVAPTAQVGERSAEGWARATLEGASPQMRASLRRGWRLLGLRLGSADDPRRVLGWPIRRSAPDLAVLAAGSPLGMRAELLFERTPQALRFATVIQLRNPLARAVWAAIADQHQRVVRHLLTGAISSSATHAATPSG
jgi:hypothetical protein